MFIVHMTYIAPTSVIEQHIASHREWVDARFADGVFLATGRVTSNTGAIVLAHGVGIETLEAIMATDPYAVHNLIKFDILEVAIRRTTKNLSYLKDEAISA